MGGSRRQARQPTLPPTAMGLLPAAVRLSTRGSSKHMRRQAMAATSSMAFCRRWGRGSRADLLCAAAWALAGDGCKV